MTPEDGQEITRSTYEDAAVVDAFLRKNDDPRFGAGHRWPRLQAFADLVGGGRILDLGCGPGIHARQFANLGFDVTAVDYSQAMIAAARALSTGGDPAYSQLDMRDVGDAFPEASFDAVWVSAALIHVPEIDVPRVLSGIRRVLTSRGWLHISLKRGSQGPRLIHDTKYGLPMEREFIFWEEDNFSRLLREAGFDIVNVVLDQGGITGTEPTQWLIFTARSG